jgi:uncharacterized secreted protein with C-terminal beta-propeller domain
MLVTFPPIRSVLRIWDPNPAGAKVLGELQISGFSSYIQSINANDTLFGGCTVKRLMRMVAFLVPK